MAARRLRGRSARAQQPATPAINIAVLTDMTGLFATLAGEGSVVAAYMAVEDFGGEVLGKKIQVFFGDHKHKVDVASDLANALVHRGPRWRNRGYAKLYRGIGNPKACC